MKDYIIIYIYIYSSPVRFQFFFLFLLRRSFSSTFSSDFDFIFGALGTQTSLTLILMYTSMDTDYMYSKQSGNNDAGDETSISIHAPWHTQWHSNVVAKMELFLDRNKYTCVHIKSNQNSFTCMRTSLLNWMPCWALTTPTNSSFLCLHLLHVISPSLSLPHSFVLTFFLSFSLFIFHRRKFANRMPLVRSVWHRKEENCEDSGLTEVHRFDK